LEWVEKAKKTKVRLAVTYALRPEARDNSKGKKKHNATRIIVNGKDISLDGIRDSLLMKRNQSPESWLSEFNNYKRLFLKNPDGATATHYATSIYSLCKKSAMLEPEEKKLVINELTKLKAAAKDELIQNIFEMSIKKLK
jgi:hypothetical protein